MLTDRLGEIQDRYGPGPCGDPVLDAPKPTLVGAVHRTEDRMSRSADVGLRSASRSRGRSAAASTDGSAARPARPLANPPDLATTRRWSSARRRGSAPGSRSRTAGVPRRRCTPRRGSGWCRCRRRPSTSMSIPDSSLVSRTAVSAMYSPKSCAPPGSAHRPLSVRWMSRTRSWSSVDEHCHGDDDAVGLRRVRVVEVLDPRHDSSVSRCPARRYATWPRPGRSCRRRCRKIAAGQPAQVQHGRVGGRHAVEVGVDQHLVIEAVDRVVQDRVVEVDADVVVRRAAPCRTPGRCAPCWPSRRRCPRRLRVGQSAAQSGSPKAGSRLVPASGLLPQRRDSFGFCSGRNRPA